MVGSRKADDPLLSQRHWNIRDPVRVSWAGPEWAVLVSLSHPDKRDHLVCCAVARSAKADRLGPVAQVVRAHP